MKQFPESGNNRCSKEQWNVHCCSLNKARGNPVNKKETTRFYDMVDDIKKGDWNNVNRCWQGFKGDQWN